MNFKNLVEDFGGYTFVKRLFNIHDDNSTIKPHDPNEGRVDLSIYEREPENEIIVNTAEIGGIQGSGITYNDNITNINDLVKKYRDMSYNSYVSDAIHEIVHELLVKDQDYIIDISLENTDLSENIKEEIYKEFQNLLSKMKWRYRCNDIMRQWYIDGRLYSQNLFEENEGLTSLKILSPFNIKRLKNQEGKQYYYYKIDETDNYNWRKFGYRFNANFTEFLLPEEHLQFTPSGVTDPTNSFYVSYLHQAIKPFNQLNMMEDSSIIYTMTRSVDRLAFYVGTGKMPPKAAEDYVKGMMERMKTKMVYNSSDGTIAQQKNVMTMNENYFIPQSDDGKGTKIESIAGGTALPDIIAIVDNFKRNLLKSLKVPYGRFDVNQPSSISFGDNAKEIARDEMRFNKFINEMRETFSINFFAPILMKHLISKKIIDKDEWYDIESNIEFIWANDQYYSEIANLERLKAKLEVLGAVSSYIGKDGYFSKGYVYRNILNMTEEDVIEMRKQIKFEAIIGEVVATTSEGDQYGTGLEDYTVEPPSSPEEIAATGEIPTGAEDPVETPETPTEEPPPEEAKPIEEPK